MPLLHLLSVLSSLILPAFSIPVNKRNDLSLPVITTDFPDPSIIFVDGTWYAFGTQSIFDFKDIRVQVATSDDFEMWEVTEIDAMVCCLRQLVVSKT